MGVNSIEIAEAIYAEFHTMQNHSHENICKVHGVCIYNKGEQVWLVMEYADCGDLNEFLTHYGGPLPRDLQFSLFFQATKAIAFLHNSNSSILHRDIKSLNFLVKMVKGESRLLLADFGASIAKSHLKGCVTDVGTLQWAAPETLAKTKPKWSRKADIYSLGMVFYEILTQQKPFCEETNFRKIQQRIACGDRPQIPANCPPV